MFLPTLVLDNEKATIYIVDTDDGEIAIGLQEPDSSVGCEMFMSLFLTYVEQAQEFIERGWEDAIDTLLNNEEEEEEE